MAATSRRVVHAFEIGIQAYIQHVGQHFSKRAPRWRLQGSRENGPMLRFCTAAMEAGPHLERLHDSIVHTTHQQVGHRLGLV